MVDYVPEEKVAEWIAIAEMDDPRTTVWRRIVYEDGSYDLVEVGGQKCARVAERRRMHEADLRQRLRDSVVQRRADNAAAVLASATAALDVPVIKYTRTQPEIIYSEAPQRLIRQRLEKPKRRR
jgi:hypothetical protein